jgi:hypothetical protein
MFVTLATGALFAVGAAVLIFSGPLSRRWTSIAQRPESERAEAKRMRVQRSAAERAEVKRRLGTVQIVQIIGALAGLSLGWVATELVGMALLLGGLGLLIPPFMSAPRRRRRQMREALAWALWSRQLAELARAGSGLVDSLKGSVEHAPREVAHTIEQVATTAELHGLEVAMDELAASGKVWEPEIAAGLRMAVTAGGAIADPLFDLCSRINDVVDLHRAKNEAVVQLWTQTIALLGLAGSVVALMYRNNPAYFDPYSSGTGQLVFIGIAGTLVGSTFFLVYHSVVREEHSILIPPKRRNRAKEPL